MFPEVSGALKCAMFEGSGSELAQFWVEGELDVQQRLQQLSVVVRPVIEQQIFIISPTAFQRWPTIICYNPSNNGVNNSHRITGQYRDNDLKIWRQYSRVVVFWKTQSTDDPTMTVLYFALHCTTRVTDSTDTVDIHYNSHNIRVLSPERMCGLEWDD